MANTVLRLCYFSASLLTEEWDVACLVEQACLHNARNGITGILLYDDGAFSQIIEGEPEAVRALFGKIQGDPRHNYVTELYRSERRERLFAAWPLAFLGRDEFFRANEWPYREMIAALKLGYGEAGDPGGRYLLDSFFLRSMAS